MSDVKWTKQHEKAWHRNKILVWHVAQVGNRMVKIIRSNAGEVFVYCYEADPQKGWVRTEDVNAPKNYDPDAEQPWFHFSTVKAEKAKAEVWLKGAGA